jgi:hypothetical protein
LPSPTSALPPENWMAVDFDDSEWAFTRNPAAGTTGASDGRGGIDERTSSIQLRTRFSVADPAKAKALVLSLLYRGGVCVYVNGREIGHKDLPAGSVGPATPAADYPVEAFMGTNALPLLPPPPGMKENDPNAKFYKMRIRTAEFPIPAGALRPGMNVLAILNNRAPYRAEGLRGHWHGHTGRTIWAQVGIGKVSLSAGAEDGVATPALPPVRVWNAGTMVMVGKDVGEPDALAELKPIRLQAPRGGSASGQVMVSADSVLTGLVATCGELAGPGGARVPSAAVRVRYAQPGTRYPNPYDALTDRPASDAKCQPVWMTVDVPADAAAGLYKGTLALRGPTSTAVGIELTVHGWTLPDARQWKSWAGLLQSPETLAVHYSVPFWSDAHFRLIEQSLVLQGELGQKVAVVPAIGGGLLGQESMVLYRRGGTKVTPDFTAVERYLKLYNQHVGDPAAVCLYLWDIHVEGHTPAERAIPVTFCDGDKLVYGTLPRFGDVATEGVWQEVVAGVTRIMKDRGWPQTSLLFGLTSDRITGTETTAFFAKHFPDVKWMTYTHGSMPAPPLKLGLMINPDQGGGHGGPGWMTPRGYPNLTNQRNTLTDGSSLTTYRLTPFITLLSGFNGPGGYGLDYWPVAVPGDRRSASRFYSGVTQGDWFRIIRGAVHGILAPGSDGPVATVRYEMLREGFQEAQALIYIETHAAGGKLPADLAKRVKEVRPRLTAQMQPMINRADVAWSDQVANLYRTAEEVEQVVAQSQETR